MAKTDYLEALIIGLAGFGILFAWFNWPMNLLVTIFTSLFIGGILSLVAGSLVESV